MKKHTNKSSLLLSPNENELVFSLLGPRCLSIDTAVVQLFVTEPPTHSQWIHRLSGVACIVRDKTLRSYFVRIFCLITHKLVWEEELYKSILISKPLDFLVTFEGQNSMVALNFANENEANNFYRSIHSLVVRQWKKDQNISEKTQTKGTNQLADATNVQNRPASPFSPQLLAELSKKLRPTKTAATPKTDPQIQKPKATASSDSTSVSMSPVTHHDPAAVSTILSKDDVSNLTDSEFLKYIGFDLTDCPIWED